MRPITLLTLLFFSCVKDNTTEQPAAKPPTLQTTAVNSITATTAISKGLINLDGGSLITERGFCYSTTPSPTIANTTIISGSGSGSFTSNLTGLTPSTTYYLRAYATNSAGTGYGNERSFATTVVTNPGAAVIFNGHTYSTIVLGNGQEWMAQNLRTTSYANGDPIPNLSNSASWQNPEQKGAWVSSQGPDSIYGKLYNWYTLIDSRNVCPTGWHVPSDAEWTALINYLGGPLIAGGKMKSTGTRYWQWPNQQATNESGFSGLPGGARSDDGSFNNYIVGVLGMKGGWWSSREGIEMSSRARFLFHEYSGVGGGYYSGTIGLSIRCVKD